MCDPIGLTYYMIITFSIYISAFFKKIYLKLTLFCIAILSAFRGNSGVDTPFYIDRFNVIQKTDLSFFEPLMPIIMKSVAFVGGDFIHFSLLWSILIFIAYAYFIDNNSNGIKIFYFILPVIYVDSLFNGLRIGMAYPIMLLSFTTKNKLSNIILVIVSHLTHITTIIRYMLNKKVLFLLLFTFIFFWSDITQFIPINVMYKLNRYGEFKVLNVYSGFADLMCLILIFYALKISAVISNKYFFTISFLTILIHFLFTIEYAALLRVYRLIIISLIAINLNKFNINSYKFFKFFGFLYIINFIRQISSTCYYDNGFLPL